MKDIEIFLYCCDKYTGLYGLISVCMSKQLGTNKGYNIKRRVGRISAGGGLINTKHFELYVIMRCNHVSIIKNDL